MNSYIPLYAIYLLLSSTIPFLMVISSSVYESRVYNCLSWSKRPILNGLSNFSPFTKLSIVAIRYTIFYTPEVFFVNNPNKNGNEP